MRPNNPGVPLDDEEPFIVPFEGWKSINEGRAGIGQIAPALRDLNARLERLERAIAEAEK